MTRRGKLARGAALLLAGTAAWGQIERGTEVTGFRVPNYDGEGRLQSMVYGDRARAVSDHAVDITNLRIETYRGDDVDARVFAEQCRYDRRRGTATSEAHVRIVRENMMIFGRGFRWQAESSRFEIFHEARVVLRGVRPAGLDRPGEADTP